MALLSNVLNYPYCDEFRIVNLTDLPHDTDYRILKQAVFTELIKHIGFE